MDERPQKLSRQEESPDDVVDLTKPVVVYDVADTPVIAATQPASKLCQAFRWVIMEEVSPYGKLLPLQWQLLEWLSAVDIVTFCMTNKCRRVLINQISVRRPVRQVFLEFLVEGDTAGIDSLVTTNFKAFTDLSHEEQTPADLLLHLEHMGLDLHGTVGCPARNAAYFRTSVFQPSVWVQITAGCTSTDLLHANCQYDQVDRREAVTVLIGGPIPDLLRPSIHEKEDEFLQRASTFRSCPVPPRVIKKRHATIDVIIASNNAFNDARKTPRKWARRLAFPDHGHLSDSEEDTVIVITD